MSPLAGGLLLITSGFLPYGSASAEVAELALVTNTSLYERATGWSFVSSRLASRACFCRSAAGSGGGAIAGAAYIGAARARVRDLSLEPAGICRQASAVCRRTRRSGDFRRRTDRSPYRCSCRRRGRDPSESEVFRIHPPPAGGKRPKPTTKVCPDCAETVLVAARVCKHCGHRWPGARTT